MVDFDEAQQLLFAGSALGLASGVFLSFESPVAGFLLSSITVVLGIIAGGLEIGSSAKSKSQVLLSSKKEKQAVRWGSFTLLLLVLFVLREIYLAFGLFMFASAAVKYFEEGVPEEERMLKAAFRGFVGLILWAAFLFPSLALLPVVVVGARFVLALAPGKIEKGVREVYH